MRRPTEKQNYVGIDNDKDYGMTEIGKIIRDAWVFGILDESQTCEGWLPQGLEDLWRKVSAEWEKYGFLVSNLPEDLRERHTRIHKGAFDRARAAGWEPNLDGDG